jgi:DNA-binding NarL/FixJ family response regulator
VCPIRILTVDDHPLMRGGIAAMIQTQEDMVLVAEAASGGDGIAQFQEQRPDITLMDLLLPDMSGIDALIDIRSEYPDARVIMLTTFEGDVEIQRALAAGARGYLLKSMPPAELIKGIREVNAGRKRIPVEIAAQIAEHVSRTGFGNELEANLATAKEARVDRVCSRPEKHDCCRDGGKAKVSGRETHQTKRDSEAPGHRSQKAHEQQQCDQQRQ